MRQASFWTIFELDLGILTASDDRLLQPVCVLPFAADRVSQEVDSALAKSAGSAVSRKAQ